MFPHFSKEYIYVTENVEVKAIFEANSWNFEKFISNENSRNNYKNVLH